MTLFEATFVCSCADASLDKNTPIEIKIPITTSQENDMKVKRFAD